MNATPHDRAAHWQTIYQTKSDGETSWHQDNPAVSLDLIHDCLPKGGRVVDVGGGASALAGHLAGAGFDVTVLDISAAALDRAKQRIGPIASQINWIVGDVTQLNEIGEFDLWHDRAAFHFLADTADRKKYASLCERSVIHGGYAIIGTFALTGPEKCSGLPAQRYDGIGIASEFSPAFTLVRSVPHVHTTPWGKPQDFSFAVLRRA
jgi:2-polyprenyl-3-methyl-5-hydroxy-6-metoxy-1,4-benzoquinol methylase